MWLLVPSYDMAAQLVVTSSIVSGERSRPRLTSGQHCVCQPRKPDNNDTISAMAAADVPIAASHVMTLLSVPLTLPAMNRRSPSMTICKHERRAPPGR
jgi:hypothetical protein